MLPRSAEGDVFTVGEPFPLFAFQERPFGNKVRPTADGLVVSGRWPFGTGVREADWVIAIGEVDRERPDVPLFAANEPITLDGSRAQRILLRGINRSVAEYEAVNTGEQSWGGLCAHTREGFNIGKPPHGYKAKIYRHPNPMKAAMGHTKSRLEPDGVRAETVTQIALWRYHENLGYDTIADRLNQDLVKYPPPETPGKTRARGAWSKTSVYKMGWRLRLTSGSNGHLAGLRKPGVLAHRGSRARIQVRLVCPV